MAFAVALIDRVGVALVHFVAFFVVDLELAISLAFVGNSLAVATLVEVVVVDVHDGMVASVALVALALRVQLDDIHRHIHCHAMDYLL